MEKLTCNGAKQIDLVDYLASLGHQPQKVNNQDYWYLSPLRDEKTPSFKVNRKLNVWYDHATGKGGNIIDFGTQYFNYSVAELLQRLSGQGIPSFSFQPQQQTGHSPDVRTSPAGERKKILTAKLSLWTAGYWRTNHYWTTCKNGTYRRTLPAGSAGRWTFFCTAKSKRSSVFRTTPEAMS